MLKKFVSLLIILTLIFTAMPNIIAETGVTLYVETYGDDTASGTQDAPLKTLAGAKAKVIQLNKSGQTVKEIVFGDGDYYMRKVSFTAEDSGTVAQPIIYRAKNPGKTKFKGSVLLDTSKATRVTSETALKRIQNTVEKNIVEIDLAAHGITKSNIYSASLEYSELDLPYYAFHNSVYVNDVEASIAQWPNGEKYASWSDTYYYDKDTQQYVEYVKGNELEGLKVTAIGYSDYEPDRWGDADGWWVAAFPDFDFSYVISTVNEIDTDKNIIRFTENPAKEYTNPYSKRWKAYNLLEELDMPGEFYVDKDALKLYIYPSSPLENSKYEISVETDSLLSIEGASNITFSGIEFSQSRKHAVLMKDINNVDFINCSFKNISAHGIYALSSNKVKTEYINYSNNVLDGNDGSYNMDITGCVFDNIGYSAIWTHGGNIDTLTPSGNVISNCYISNANKLLMWGGAVMLGGCGNVFKNNVVTRMPGHAVNIAGNNHIILNNEVYDVMRLVGDGGAIYQGKHTLQRGSEIVENYIHDVTPTDSRLKTSTVAIYFDDGQQGISASKNIIVNAQKGFNSHYATAFGFTDNIVVGDGIPWAFLDNQKQNADFKFTPLVKKNKNGTVVVSDGRFEDFKGLISSIQDKELYFSEYPELAAWADESEDTHPHKYTEYYGNLAVTSTAPVLGEQLKFYAKTSNTEGVDDDNLIVASTQAFVDPENHDYRLKSDSYLAKKMPGLLNSDNFSMSKIGIQQNTLMFNKDTSPYQVLYPATEQKVSKKGLTLLWTEAFGANEYYVEISKTSDFSDNIWSATARFNHVDVPSYYLTEGETYYWRVTAINTSFILGARWTNGNDSVGKFVIMK